MSTRWIVVCADRTPHYKPGFTQPHTKADAATRWLDGALNARVHQCGPHHTTQEVDQ